MATDHTPLYVRLSTDPSGRLEKAVAISGKTKRRLVEDAVRAHLTDDGLVVGRVSLREDPPEVLTLAEAASLLRIDKAALRQAAQNEELPARLLGEEWRFSRAALLAWLAGPPTGVD